MTFGFPCGWSQHRKPLAPASQFRAKSFTNKYRQIIYLAASASSAQSSFPYDNSYGRRQFSHSSEGKSGGNNFKAFSLLRFFSN